ncbi:MAG: hypothetical protein ACFHX7_01860 [Pseudomonadota bacterium]
MTESLIQQLHNAPGKAVIAATGGGSSAISALLAVPGASRTLMEATVPYDPASLASYIGGTPDQACSGRTARALAMASFQRARRLEPDESIVFGLGCTAALTTDRARRGLDRCFVACQSIDETREYELHLSRTGRDRATQEMACARLILNVLAEAFGIAGVPLSLLPDESLFSHRQQAEPAWRELFSGHLAFTNHSIPKPRLLFPGAFNPLHEGHRAMAEVAAEITGTSPLLEISTFNVDKPPLDFMDMRAREEGLHHAFEFTFTNAPTFVAKAHLFPDAVFMVGSDTLARIGQPKYYHNSTELRDLAIGEIRDLGVTFLCFGRLQGEQFMGVDEIALPPRLREISRGVPEATFRMDMSSSSIRRNGESTAQ